MSRSSFSQLAWLVVVVCVGVAAASCGGDKDDDGGGNGTDPVPVVPGSRLAWNQGASSVQQLQQMTFKLYIDGATGSMADVKCGTTPTNGAYECSGRLPGAPSGRHVLELSAVLNGVEGSRSAPLTIMLGAASQTARATIRLTEQPSASSAVCVTSRECYDVRVVAAGLDDSSMLAVAPDHRLFFIEGGTRVRIVADGLLLRDPALMASSPDAHLVGLALDTAFDRTRSVFVAWTETVSTGTPVLNITRYRELAGTLAEGATIVSGLPFQDDSMAPLAVDREGRLFVALPPVATASAGRDVGKVLWFTRDGFVPAGSTASSPIIARGYARPSGLAVDSVRSQLWLSGEDDQLASLISALAISEERSALRAVGPSGPVSSGPAMAVLTGSTAERWLLVARGQDLLRASIGSDGVPGEFTKMPIDTANGVRGIAGSIGSWYVATASGDGTGSILHFRQQ